MRYIRKARLSDAEHRIDEGSIGGHVRQQEQDVVRTECRVGGEGGEELVAEHLHLAHRRVAAMYRERVVDRVCRECDGSGERALRSPLNAESDIRLKAREDRSRVVVRAMVLFPRE